MGGRRRETESASIEKSFVHVFCTKIQVMFEWKNVRLENVSEMLLKVLWVLWIFRLSFKKLILYENV